MHSELHACMHSSIGQKKYTLIIEKSTHKFHTAPKKEREKRARERIKITNACSEYINRYINSSSLEYRSIKIGFIDVLSS
jgi:hypothetical protein